MDKIKLGIIGAGRLGGFHADKGAIHPEVILTGIYDPCQMSRERVAQKHGVPAFADLDSLLSLVDAVVIAAPSLKHYELGMKCLEDSKHVLMEKPLATIPWQAKELRNTANRKNLVLHTGHVEQYNPVWQAAQPFLKTIMGRESPCFLETRRTSCFPFRCLDVNVVLDIMIHDLGLILELLGTSAIIAHKGQAFTQMGGLEDIAMGSLSFANGTNANLYASRVELEPSRKMRIVTSYDILELDFQTRHLRYIVADDEIQRLNLSKKEELSIFGVPNPVEFAKEHHLVTEMTCDSVDALSLEMDDFCQSILNHKPSRVPIDIAVNAVDLACSFLQ